MNARTLIIAGLSLSIFMPFAVDAATSGWPETIARLTGERSQAQACVELLSATGTNAAITQGRTVYGAAKAASDGAIAGFMIVLVEGGKPATLPDLKADLERVRTGLDQLCRAATKAAADAGETRGVVDEAVKAAVGPVVDALKSAADGLWARHVALDNRRVGLIQQELEAAKWPPFGAAQRP